MVLIITDECINGDALDGIPLDPNYPKTEQPFVEKHWELIAKG